MVAEVQLHPSDCLTNHTSYLGGRFHDREYPQHLAAQPVTKVFRTLVFLHPVWQCPELVQIG
jgi:hypothetical protein